MINLLALFRSRPAWSLAALPAALAALGSTALFSRQAPPAPPAPPAEAAPAPAAKRPRPDGNLRIGLRSLSGRDSIGVKLLSAGHVLDLATGRKLKPVPANVPLKVIADYASGTVVVKGKGIWVSRPELALAGRLVSVSGRRYPGSVQFRLGGTGLQLVNALEIEQYLEGVLPGELPASFGLEAQKALAVAARSYALVQRGKHGEYDLCDGTCCQMYLGQHRASPKALRAVRSTRHLCLWSGKELVYAFYSADCGGISTRVEDVPLRDKPDRPLPYLRVVKDAPAGGADYCGKSPFHSWTKRFTRAEIEARLNRKPETAIGRLVGLEITGTDPSGRVTAVRLRGKAPARVASAGAAPAVAAPVEKTITGWELRNALGATRLKSTLMTLDEPQPGVYRFSGSGFGHGLGLCQIGANAMAQRGLGFRRILAHYYPGTAVRPL